MLSTSLTDNELHDLESLITARSSFERNEQNTLIRKLRIAKDVIERVNDLDLDDIIELIDEKYEGDNINADRIRKIIRILNLTDKIVHVSGEKK